MLSMGCRASVPDPVYLRRVIRFLSGRHHPPRCRRKRLDLTLPQRLRTLDDFRMTVKSHLFARVAKTASSQTDYTSIDLRSVS
jgi:hypothetical protein